MTRRPTLFSQTAPIDMSTEQQVIDSEPCHIGLVTADNMHFRSKELSVDSSAVFPRAPRNSGSVDRSRAREDAAEVYTP